MNQQHFCVPGNWSTKDVCRIKLGIVRHAFAFDSTEILYLDEQNKVWKLVESDYEKVKGETVACLFTFEEVPGEEWAKVAASAVVIAERLRCFDL